MNTTNSSNQSPLDIACRYSQGDSVQMLLEAGADPDKLHNGCHPIHIAVDAKSDSCVATLLEFHPEQVNVRDSKYGGTPLHWAKTKEVKPLLALYSSANIFIYSHDQTPTAISGPFQILVTKQKKSLFLSEISSSVRFMWSFFVVVIVRGVFFRTLEMMYAV